MNDKKLHEDYEEVSEEINLSYNLTIAQLDDDADENDISEKGAYTSAGEGVQHP